MKHQVSEKQPSCDSELVKVRKEAWIKEIAKEYCESLINK